MTADPFALGPDDLKDLRFEILDAEALVADDPLVGNRLGRYRVVKRLGIGGWGVAYYARHIITDRPFTIKVLADSLAVSTVFVRRFLKEAKLTAQLDHPNIRQVFDVDQDLARYYMVMEYVDGVGLQSLIRANRTVPPRVAARIAGQVARGLAYAFERGVIHRDVKPRNILVGKNGAVKLTDFGLARVLEENEDFTQSLGVLETLEFQSPEHLGGWECDTKNDIYSLGATLYYMLAGEVPFHAPDRIALLQRIDTEDTPSPRAHNSAVPTALEQVVIMMMNRYAFLRHQSWQDAIDDLARFLTESEPRARGTETREG